MLEFSDKGTSLLMKKSYRMESEEGSRKRKCQELLVNDDIFKRAEVSSFDQKRRRFNEETKNMNLKNIEEGYYHQGMSLDLELNLSPSLIDLNHDYDLSSHNRSYEDEKKKKMIENGPVLGLQTRKAMAWVAFDLEDDGRRGRDGGDGGGGEEEMVARVCIKCHMLVMLCKASPACPNCKFMHSPEDTSLSLLFNPKTTLLA